MNKDLRYFLDRVKKMGPEYYLEVNKPLKPYLEPCIIQEKLAKEGKFPIIYYPEIVGSKIPLISNTFGCFEMYGQHFDMDPKTEKVDILYEYLQRVKDLKPVKKVAPEKAPVREVIWKGKDADLDLLPILHHQELNSGKYIGIGFMVCVDPVTGIPNAGVYRHEVRGKHEMGAMIHPANHGAHIARRYAELGKPMEVALVCGHHPAVVQGSITRGPLELSEYEVMGGLLGEPLEVVNGETVNVPIPAWAEIVIEGTVDPTKMSTDGPYSEWPGYYGPEYHCYVINVTAITMRKDAIFYDLDPGHQEHGMSGSLPSAAAIWDAVKRVVPSVQTVNLPPSANCRSTVYISIKKRVEGEAKLAALAALSAQFFTHTAVIVDDDIDVFDERDVWWAVSTRAIADEDFSIIPRVTSTLLNPCSYDETRLDRGAMLTYVIIDATRPINRPFLTKVTPNEELWQSMNLDDYITR